MSTDHNPYRPPAAHVQEDAPPLPDAAEGFLPHGDLALAQSGVLRLKGQDTVKEAWARTDGVKLQVTGFLLVLGFIYFMGLGLALVLGTTLAGFEPADFIDPVKSVELIAHPEYTVTTGLVAAPLQAFLYLGVWNLGMRRAAGLPLRIIDAFPVHCLVRASVVNLLVASVGMLAFIHPYAGYVGLPVSWLTFWTLPLFLDRDMGVFEAIRVSSTLAVKNIPGMFFWGGVVTIAYFAASLTCGFAFFWFFPFVVASMGVAWRQLAGFDRIAVGST